MYIDFLLLVLPKDVRNVGLFQVWFKAGFKGGFKPPFKPNLKPFRVSGFNPPPSLKGFGVWFKTSPSKPSGASSRVTP